RTVALDEGTVAVLIGQRVRIQAERAQVGLRALIDDDLVFGTLDGRPLLPEFLADAFDRNIKLARLPRITLHGLRHSHATHALEAGVHVRTVADRLGHSTTRLTLDLYSHAVPSLQVEAAQKVADLVWKTGDS